MNREPDTREFQFPPDPGHVRLLRESARDAAQKMGIPQTADMLALVLDELANNAIEHGSAYRTGTQDLRVRVARAPNGLWVDFEDPEMPLQTVQELAAALSDAEENGLPAIESERGRGLYLIAIHFEEMEITSGPTGGFLLRGLLSVTAA